MTDLKINLDNIYGFVSKSDVYGHHEEITRHLKTLYNGTGKGNDFLGWINLPGKISDDLIKRIVEDASHARAYSEIYVVVGIGGSYLGARAVIEALGHSFHDISFGKGNPHVIFAGNQLSEDYMADLLDLLDRKDYSLAVISKSGTTTEPAIAFRILKNHLERKYGKQGARKRVIAITDKEKGALKKLSDHEGYVTYEVPDDIGGRYSVLTPVGLLPIAVAGFDISKLVTGARKMQLFASSSNSMSENPVISYAAARNALYRKGKIIEILVNYLPTLFYFTEWWKQLYGESEGKEGKGIFPAGVSFTTDLHSMGQYIQEGLRQLFETVISVENARREVLIPVADNDDDGLNYLAGKRIQHVNKMAEIGTMLAHVEGGVPNIRIKVPAISEDTLGQLIYFFEIACGLSGYMLGVNPFDQPGVEAYKKNMFALLGKPGYEDATKKIRKNLNL